MTCKSSSLLVCVLFTWIAFTGLLQAQPHVIIKGSRHYLQQIGIEEHNALNPYGQKMLIEYATALATNPNKLNTFFQCEISRESTLAANGELIIRFRIISGSVRGDATLRGFDISDVLLPSLFNATLLLSNSAGDTLLYEPQKSLRLNQGNSSFIRFVVEMPPETDTVWVEIKDLFFSHEHQNVQQLITRVQKIADYYAADYLLKNVQDQIADINCRQYDLLPQCFLSLLEADRILAHIKKANFAENLLLGLSDPVDFQRRFEVISNTYAYLMREFTSTLRHTNRIYLTQTLETIVSTYIDGITRHINDHPEPGFAAAPFINQLSSIEFAGKEFEQKAGFFRQIATKINPGTPPEEAVSGILEMIYMAMLEKAREYVSNVEFNKAVVLFENAGRFCEAFNEIECSEEAFYELSKAKYGLYGFYLTVAQRAIEMQRPDIASAYVFLGREYQQKNRKLIIHDGEVITMLVKLFDAWVLEASKYNRAEKYDSAMILLKRIVQPDIGITPSSAWHNEIAIALNGMLAHRLSDFEIALDAELLNTTESMYYSLARFIDVDMQRVEMFEANKDLYNRLQRIFTDQLIDAASLDIRQEYFEESMRKLLLARSVSANNAKEQGQQLDSLSLIAGREVIKQILRKTVSLINKGKTDEGFELYSSALLKSREYGLEEDELTVNRLDDIYNAYLKIKCMQLQSQLDQVLLQAKRLAGLKMYLAAVDTVNSIYNLIKSNSACRLSLQESRRFLADHQHAADYQLSLLMADRALSNNDFLACLRHVETAEMLYGKHSLREYGLKPVSLIEYAKKQGNSFLYWFVVRRYLQLLQFDQAFQVLEILREDGVTSDEASEVLQELGVLMGRADRTEVKFFQSFSKAKDYSGGNSWYKPFHRAYRQGLGYRFPWFF